MIKCLLLDSALKEMCNLSTDSEAFGWPLDGLRGNWVDFSYAFKRLHNILCHLGLSSKKHYVGTMR